jgi:hypothetical protein
VVKGGKISKLSTSGIISDVQINTIRKEGRGQVKWIAAATQGTLVKEFTVTV